METLCADCLTEWDMVHNICPKCDEDTFEWTLAITTNSEVRRFGVSFGRVDRKEWEKGLNKPLLWLRNKELEDACVIFDLWERDYACCDCCNKEMTPENGNHSWWLDEDTLMTLCNECNMLYLNANGVY